MVLAFLLGFLLGALLLAALEAAAALLLVRRLHHRQAAAEEASAPAADERPGERPLPYEKQVSATPLLAAAVLVSPSIPFAASFACDFFFEKKTCKSGLVQ
ncbi:unnamed protein product [Urochloa humidicola]